jgi:hypothetical protein
MQFEELTVGLYVLCSWIYVQQVFAVIATYKNKMSLCWFSECFDNDMIDIFHSRQKCFQGVHHCSIALDESLWHSWMFWYRVAFYGLVTNVTVQSNYCFCALDIVKYLKELKRFDGIFYLWLMW